MSVGSRGVFFWHLSSLHATFQKSRNLSLPYFTEFCQTKPVAEVWSEFWDWSCFNIWKLIFFNTLKLKFCQDFESKVCSKLEVEFCLSSRELARKLSSCRWLFHGEVVFVVRCSCYAVAILWLCCYCAVAMLLLCDCLLQHQNEVKIRTWSVTVDSCNIDLSKL